MFKPKAQQGVIMRLLEHRKDKMKVQKIIFLHFLLKVLLICYFFCTFANEILKTGKR